MIWLQQKWWLCLLLLVGLLAACSAAAVPANLRVGTWNLENFDGKNPQKVNAISQIVEANFDVLGAQEISPTAAELLKKRLNQSPNQRHWQYVIGQSGQRQRVAVFYRDDRVNARTLGEWNKVNLTGTLRSPLVTYIEAKQGFNFTFVVVHQKGGGGDQANVLRQQQGELLRQEIASFQSVPSADPDLIVVGDFNNPSWAAANEPLRRSALTFLTQPIETDAGYNCLAKRKRPHFPNGRVQFSNRGTGCVIDHIAVFRTPRGAEEEYLPQSIQILDPRQDLGFSSEGDFFRQVSDHLPVRAVFRSQ
ncbi:MAG: endonuclease/exonuclease/phosphatase family protein [Pseudanabaenaceae cyanobacterium]|jgi:endonuclease/exonuclease/phosphatase family metal-dependent hydrolase